MAEVWWVLSSGMGHNCVFYVYVAILYTCIEDIIVCTFILSTNLIYFTYYTSF